MALRPRLSTGLPLSRIERRSVDCSAAVGWCVPFTAGIRRTACQKRLGREKGSVKSHCRKSVRKREPQAAKRSCLIFKGALVPLVLETVDHRVGTAVDACGDVEAPAVALFSPAHLDRQRREQRWAVSGYLVERPEDLAGVRVEAADRAADRRDVETAAGPTAGAARQRRRR